MIVYWFLLLFTSIFAYGFGSTDTLVLASNLVFRTSLRRLGRGNVWLSNFWRIYGVRGFLKLLLVELVKDCLPIILGGLILSIKGHGDVGRVFAGFCVVLGRLYPLFYDFRGSHAAFPLIVTGIFAQPSVGIAAAVVMLAVTVLSRYVSLGVIAGSFVAIAVSVLMVDDNLIMRLMIIACALSLFQHIPALARVLNGREPRLSFREDISYKLDQKF